MTWTYSGDPSSTNRDAVRFLVGDTDNTDQLVTDEEIAYALAQEGNAYNAAARMARGLASKFARHPDQSLGDLSISYSQRYKHFTELAKKLETEGSSRRGVPYAGGISKADKDTVSADSDRIQPAIRVGVHDSPGLSTDDDEE